MLRTQGLLDAEKALDNREWVVDLRECWEKNDAIEF